MIQIPAGPVFGPLRITYLTPKGAVAHHAWPARRWDDVRLAMLVGHKAAEQHRIGTYALELEIVRELAA